MAAVLVAICFTRSAIALTNLPAFSPMVNKVIVDINGGEPQRQEKLHQLASEIIGITPGTPFSKEALLLAIEQLKQTGRFSHIDVPDQNWEAQSVDLVFMLTPIVMIKKITVSGAFPIFKDEVIDVTDYVPGGGFDPNKVEQNRTAVLELLNRNGYIDPFVDITTAQKGDHEVSVLIRIDKKQHTKISRIDVNGNQRFSDTRLKMMMQTYQMPIIFWSKGERAVRENLEKDIKKLVAFYRKKGFADVKIEHRIENTGENNLVTVQIIVDEGPEYRIHFIGNQEFTAYTLKKDLILKTKGNANDFGLKRSIRNLRERYRQSGYPKCKIEYTDKFTTDRGRNFRDIYINITENTRHLVRSSVISGAASIDKKTLKKEVLTNEKALTDQGAFLESRFKNDQLALENAYLSRGYTDTRVDASIKWTQGNGNQYADVNFDISEGYRKITASLEITGLPGSLEAEIRQLIKTRAGEPYIKSVVQKDRQEIIAFLARKGYIYATVEAHITKGEKKEEVAVKFIINPEVKAVAGGVWAFGNLRTKDSILLRHATIETNAPVSLDNYLVWQKDVRNLNCVEKANFKVIGLQENHDTLFFLAEVEEKKPYYMEFATGYDTARDAYFRVSVGDRNFMGMNRILSLDAEISGVGYEARAGLEEFDFLSQYIVTELSVYTSKEELKNQTFGTETIGTTLSFEKDLSTSLKIGTSLSVEIREQFEVSTSPDHDPDDFDTRGVFNFTPFITWSSVDSFVKPTKGFYFNVSAGYNKDVLEDLDHFIKYRAKAKYYYQPFSRLVLAFQGMYGFIQNLSGTDNLPDDQLFFLGGISDVRGFNENELVLNSLGDPVGGEIQIAASIEARIDLGMNFELPLFLDIGSIRETDLEDEPDEFRFTVGTGLRYMTPVGPVGLLYGYKLNPEDGEDESEVHFSIGYTF